jgi:cytochrome c oxidase cbb3-type subunit III
MADEHKPDTLKDDGHAFDGIQEYDNNLPRWWLMLFYATIVWAVWYIPFYSGGPGKVGPDRLKEDLASLAAERAKLNAGGELDEAGLRALASDPARIDAGKALYEKQSCATCHGGDASGGAAGPSLRDRFWIHPATMTGITTVLTSGGRPGRGMAAYGARLSQDEIRSLAVYIVSLNRAGFKSTKTPGADEKETPIDW